MRLATASSAVESTPPENSTPSGRVGEHSWWVTTWWTAATSPRASRSAAASCYKNTPSSVQLPIHALIKETHHAFVPLRVFADGEDAFVRTPVVVTGVEPRTVGLEEGVRTARAGFHVVRYEG